ncbi:MAG: penicillin-binding transpeptidase domain-containing protein [Planctomycetota bacterium]
MGGRSPRLSGGLPFAPASAASPVAASGLRPAAAFVGVVLVFLAVATRSLWIQVFASGEQPDAVVRRIAPIPGFSIVDRDGRALALSVECFDVTVSPRSMWRSHTPDHMARRIAAILAPTDDVDASVQAATSPWTESDVLVRTMPRALEEGHLPGRLVPEEPALLVFEGEDLEPIQRWLDTGAVGEREPGPPLRGFSLALLRARADAPDVRRWTLAFEPVAALGAEARREQLGVTKAKDGSERVPPPERWTRRLLDDLIGLVGRDRLMARLPDDQRVAIERCVPIERRERLRDAVWAELMPTRFRVVARAVDPVRAHALRDMLLEEGVSAWQLQLVPRVERRHPTRPGGRPAPPDDRLTLERSDDAFWLLGHWGVLDEERAEMRARRDRQRRPHVLPWEDAEDPFEAYRTSLVVEQKPWSGIELLCRTELEDGPWSDLVEAVRGRAYASRRRHLARDRRRAWSGPVPSYFEDATDATDVPAVVTTLDARLQEAVHAELALLFDRHMPALAMAIVVDVDTGDVLALDTRSAYAYSGFAPVLHEFTPGSTFKAIVMAIALDAGVTTPDARYETFAGSEMRVGSRSIGEAEGAPEAPVISAAEALAHSCNAVLVQIALGLDPRALRGKLSDLGYGTYPGVGLGPERDGSLPPLERGTWKRSYTHASIGFGHEIGVTLWQHAEALATVLRGGLRRPLRLIRAVEHEEYSAERPLASPARVLSQRACDEVRAMMAFGAEEGTGRHVGKLEANPDLEWIGTKTGTTEKVATELCVHVELEALATHAHAGTRLTRAGRAALLDVARPHRSANCYTSSMCAVGRVRTEAGPREVMVLVVADDPTGPAHFGSKVTGPTAMAILRQAFGLPRDAPAPEPVSTGDPADDAADRPIDPSRVLFRAPEPRTTERAGRVRPYDASWLEEDLPWAAPARVPGAPEGAR